MTQPPGALHAPANIGKSVKFALDNQYLARIYNAAWRTNEQSISILLSVYFESRTEVDTTYARLLGSGYKGRQPP